MRVTSGRVIAGKVEIEGEPLAEGTEVTVLALDGDQCFALDAEAEVELLESIAEADRGQTVDSNVVLQGLRDQE
jgi:hypothetical protein